MRYFLAILAATAIGLMGVVPALAEPGDSISVDTGSTPADIFPLPVGASPGGTVVSVACGHYLYIPVLGSPSFDPHPPHQVDPVNCGGFAQPQVVQTGVDLKPAYTGQH